MQQLLYELVQKELPACNCYAIMAAVLSAAWRCISAAIRKLCDFHPCVAVQCRWTCSSVGLHDVKSALPLFRLQLNVEINVELNYLSTSAARCALFVYQHDPTT